MRNKKLIAMICILSALAISIIVISVIFLVRNVTAYSYTNEDTAAYDSKVIKAAAIKNNSSILLLNENEIIKNVEKKLFDVEVINIERKYPSTVSINYVRHGAFFEYTAVEDGTTYYYNCYSNGKVYQKSLTASTNHFMLVFNDQKPVAAGNYFSSGASFNRVRDLYEMFIAYDYKDSSVAQIATFIDITKSSNVYIRMKSGCGFDIQSITDREDLKEKFSLAMSTYTQREEFRSGGTIIVYGKNNATYNTSDAVSYYHANYTT